MSQESGQTTVVSSLPNLNMCYTCHVYFVTVCRFQYRINTLDASQLAVEGLPNQPTVLPILPSRLAATVAKLAGGKER